MRVSLKKSMLSFDHIKAGQKNHQTLFCLNENCSSGVAAVTWDHPVWWALNIGGPARLKYRISPLSSIYPDLEKMSLKEVNDKKMVCVK